MTTNSQYELNKGLAQMLKGGVIMDVTTPEQAKIAEAAGACAVMALERIPADIRAAGGVSRMSDPKMIKGIQDAVSIPVMAKCRIGHFVEAQILQAVEIDYIDESEVLSPADDAYLSEKMFQAKEIRDYQKALYWNDKRMESATFGTSFYALVTYDRSGILRTMGKDDESLYYLILSAISDVRSAIKEQSSIMNLAQIMYERGDITRANTYINFSWSVTEAYKTRMRNWRHIIPYSMINSRFQGIISKQNEKLQFYLLLITLLSFLLGVTLMYVYRQMMNLKVAKEKQQSLNKDLTVANNNFKKANLELLDSNNIKEVYISRFFKLCSTYVDRMHNFRKQVNKKLLKKEYSDLMKMTSCASDLLVTEQQELYEHFDSAFLHIFPNFVTSVNDLLLPDEQFILKEGELLNTELRICALIRLGFVKSAQIAELLHYSPTTIYNYRTRLREKALSRDVFEEKVMQIQ